MKDFQYQTDADRACSEVDGRKRKVESVRHHEIWIFGCGLRPRWEELAALRQSFYRLCRLNAPLVQLPIKNKLSTSGHFPRSIGILWRNCDPASGFFHTQPLLQLILNLDHTSQALEIYRRDPEWRLPELWRHEFLNVLSGFLRFESVPVERLLLAWRHAAGLFDAAICEIDMSQALKIAGERDISAYDAQYIALAIALPAPLITEDRKLRRAAPRETISMLRFLSKNRH